MEWQKVFYEFLIVTVPAVILYFIGWGYLYYYFGAFGINIAEVHIDVPTIFIYSVPVVQNAVVHYLYYLLVVLVLLPAAVLLLYSQLKVRQKNKVKAAWTRAATAVAEMSLWAKLALLIVVLVGSALAMRPIIEAAALETAMRIWTGSTTVVIALPEAKGEGSPKPVAPSVWSNRYEACSKKEALRLIYADDNAYYLLCMKEDTRSGQGDVFEVRRKEGLVSVRFAERE